MCATEARINRRLPPPGDTRRTSQPPALGVCPPGGSPGASLGSSFGSCWLRAFVSRHPVGRPRLDKRAQEEAGDSSGSCPAPAAQLMARVAPGSGAGPLPLLPALALGLVILHCVLADGNSTRSPENDGLLCGDHAENCPVTTTQPKRRGHFSRCPKQYKHYCIKGRCRFVLAEQTPSCVCDKGYAGARCERIDLFYLRGDRGQILVICLIAVMVIFIILVVSICTCCQ